MIGTSPQTMGGISSVVDAYRVGGLFTRMPVTYLSTHRDGSCLAKLFVATRALAIFWSCLVFRSNFVLHVHASSRASFWRKCMFMVPALWMRRPVVVHLHGSEFMEFYEQECIALQKAIIRYVLDHCTKILVLSQSWRRSLAGITRNASIEVLLNPAVRREACAPSGGRQDHALLFLGRLGRRKGIYVLLTALVAVRERYPDVVLVCGGDGDLEEVRATAAKLGLHESVRILGWVKGSAKDALLESASVYVLPSFAEGVPMSVLEAMAAGLPVISTAVGGIPEVITHGTEGLLVPSGDPIALSEAICRLLGNAELREQMGQSGRARFQLEFSIESVLENLESVYRSLGVLPRDEKPGTDS